MQTTVQSVVSRLQLLRGRSFTTTTYKMSAAEELGHTLHPNNFERKLLLKARMYNRMEEIPDRVSPLKMKLAIDWFRIRVNFATVVLGFIGCAVGSVYYRHLRDEGANLNLQYQQQIKEWQKRGKEEQAMKIACEN